MNRTDVELESTVERVTPILLGVSEEAASKRPRPGAWSAKEIIGHLIDSAANNHRRFVEAQYRDDLVFPGYDQNAWVSAQRYQERPWRELVSLWHSYNLHLCHIIAAVPQAVREKVQNRHNLHEIAWRRLPETESTTLEYFMADYVEHLRHHISQAFRVLGVAEAW